MGTRLGATRRVVPGDTDAAPRVALTTFTKTPESLSTSSKSQGASAQKSSARVECGRAPVTV